MHKGFKYLDISKGRIYISRDVLFDESVFPFAELHSNAGAHYHSEFLLLPMTTTGNNVITNLINAPTTIPLSVLSTVQMQTERPCD
jgi:hypothetical protein